MARLTLFIAAGDLQPVVGPHEPGRLARTGQVSTGEISGREEQRYESRAIDFLWHGYDFYLDALFQLDRCD